MMEKSHSLTLVLWHLTGQANMKYIRTKITHIIYSCILVWLLSHAIVASAAYLEIKPLQTEVGIQQQFYVDVLMHLKDGKNSDEVISELTKSNIYP